jgi:hypothetical protein
MSKPFILIIPGSFAPPHSYDAVIKSLRASGFQAVALQLPSTQKRMPLKPATMMDDADVIRRAVETILAQGKEVIAVCHSYGGTPTTQALVGLKVKRIVYLTAIVPKLGESNVEALGGEKSLPPMEATVRLPPYPLIPHYFSKRDKVRHHAMLITSTGRLPPPRPPNHSLRRLLRSPLGLGLRKRTESLASFRQFVFGRSYAARVQGCSNQLCVLREGFDCESGAAGEVYREY